jgi:hypothetical protein
LFQNQILIGTGQKKWAKKAKEESQTLLWSLILNGCADNADKSAPALGISDTYIAVTLIDACFPQ